MKTQATAGIPQDKELMGLFTIEELREVISVKVLAGQDALSGKRRIRQIGTDSRSIRRGDLFVALRGDRFDGHEFVPDVLAKGAAGAIVHDEYRLPPRSAAVRRIEGLSAPFLFGVRDPLFAYQQLATHYRSRFTIPMVAVTGSNGKTTTKDMVASVLAQRWSVLKTEGNFNNRIGVPSTLFRLTARHQAAVIEMGVDQQGQTTRLCEIVRPTIGLITNIGPDHLEFLGSMEGSAQSKAELLDMLPADGMAILNADDTYFDYLAARAVSRHVVWIVGDGRCSCERDHVRCAPRHDLSLAPPWKEPSHDRSDQGAWHAQRHQRARCGGRGRLVELVRVDDCPRVGPIPSRRDAIAGGDPSRRPYHQRLLQRQPRVDESCAPIAGPVESCARTDCRAGRHVRARL